MNIDRRMFLTVMASSAATIAGSRRAVAASESGWPTYGYDELKSRNNPEGEKLPDGLSGLGELWVSDGNSKSDAVAANGTVYAGFENGKVKALNPTNGTKVWSFSTEYNQSVSNSPAVSDGSVYVGGDRGALYSIDASTGETEWSKSLDNEITSSPTIAGDSVYFGTNDGVYELSLADGNRNKKMGTSSPVRVSPVITDNRVFIAAGSDLYGLNRFTGIQEWKEAAGGFLTEMVADSSRIYILTGTVRAFFQDTGDKRWGRSVAGSPSGSPVVYNDRIYIGTDIGNIQSLNLDDSGTQEWNLNIGGEVRGTPLIVDGVLYAVSADDSRAKNATLYAINPETGDQLGTSSIDYDVNAGPTVAYGNAYVSTRSGVYGYGKRSGPTASFDVEPNNPSVGDNVSFDASSSSRGIAPIQSYNWEFESPDTSFEESGEVIERTTDSAGEWEVSLTVTDREGISDTTVVQISVSESSTGDDNAGGDDVDTGSSGDDGTTGDGEGGSEEEDAGEDGLLPASVSRMLPEPVSDGMAIAASGVGAVLLGGLGILAYSRRRSDEKEGGRKAEYAKTCPECGTGLDESIVFCTECGTKVEHKEDTRDRHAESEEVVTDTEDEGVAATEQSVRSGEETEDSGSEVERDTGEGIDEDLSSPRSPGQPPGSDTAEGIDEQESSDESTTPVGGPQSETEEDSEPSSGKLCPECGEVAGEDSRYCISCGADIERRSSGEATISCPECGDEVDEDSRFCISCGATLEGHGKGNDSNCPECGSEVDEDSKFCISCGAEL